MKPYCFVLIPFGEKKDESGRSINFDYIYNNIIHPAICDARLTPIRADEEIIWGIIHKPMFEKLMLCDFAVADLTTANANVLYELGIRHGVRPHSTVLMAGRGTRLPFDISPLRALLYELDERGVPSNSADTKQALATCLEECWNPEPDSPLFQLVQEMPRPDLDHLKTDRFRELVEYAQDIKSRLSEARTHGRDAVSAIEKELNVFDADPAILVDLLLSYRAVDAHEEMKDLILRMPEVLRHTVMIQEQLGFALNRLGDRGEAVEVLKKVIENFGPSSETNGLLGRVYKDYWKDCKNSAQDLLAKGYLKKSIEAYVEGFETDWRDAYPGVNAVTLMEVSQDSDHRKDKLLPIVQYAVERRLDSKSPDYWDYATLLELSILQSDESKAYEMLEKTLVEVRESWELETTAQNLSLIRQAREQRACITEWISDIEEKLMKRRDQIRVE